MSYILDSITIARPLNLEEGNNTQFAQVRTLSGAVNRDYFGSNKRTFVLDYANKTPADYAIIRAIYDSYLSTGTAKVFEITEGSYTVTATVHIDLARRKFSVGGSSYISDASLILTEV